MKENMDNKERLKNLIKKLHKEEDFEAIKNDFIKNFSKLKASELASIEGELIQEGLPLEEVQRLCSVHSAVFQGSIEDIHSQKEIDKEFGHPLFIFISENDGLEKYLSEKLEPLLVEFEKNNSEDNRLDLLACVSGLKKIDRHYSRKENLFFPYLEAAGITAPPKVMWGVDDDIRVLLKKDLVLIEKNSEDILVNIRRLLIEIREMIKKENEILAPMLAEKIKNSQWITIAEASIEIGFAFNGGIEGASPSDAWNWLEKAKGENITDDDVNEGKEPDGDTIVLPSGRLSKEELVSMLNSIPCDLTFIGADDLVRYFSEGKNPVFPRTRTIIGRDVRNCHPPKVLDIVNKLIKDLKLGNKDEESRIMLRGSKIFLIRYIAVKDGHNKFIGILETTEEVSDLYSKINQEIDRR